MAACETNTKVLKDFLCKHKTVKYIRLQWVDYSGVQHAQLAPPRTCLKLASGEIDHLTLAQDCMIIPISTAPQSFSKKPEAWELHPDWSSLLLCGFRPSHASVMCFMVQRGAEDPTANCPRTLLHRILHDVEASHSMALLVGFEAEFVLLDDSLNPPSQPLDPVLGNSTLSGLRGRLLTIMEEMVAAIEAAEIQVHNFHTEGVDHFEIAMNPDRPMQAVDALMHAHESIRTIAVLHGFKATFAVQPTLSSSFNARNGSHVHVSLDPPTHSDKFLTGTLSKLEALCAIGLANHDSYVRIGDEGTGAWIGFGTENRGLPVRKISEAHWEFRCVDAIANMYLFLAALLSAGAHGIDKCLPLTWTDLANTFTWDMAPAELAKYGIVKRMPVSLQASLDALMRDMDLRCWLGKMIHRQYVDLKLIEIKNWMSMSHADRTKRCKGLEIGFHVTPKIPIIVIKTFVEDSTGTRQHNDYIAC